MTISSVVASGCDGGSASGFWLDCPLVKPKRQHAVFLSLMGQKKLQRFEAINSFPNVLQYPQGISGRWHEFFKNHHPITLELACGKGEYTVALAHLYPERNFLGVDVKGNRIFVGASRCISEGLSNAGFLRSQIDHIDSYFARGEVQEIWITFPDPQLRRSRAKKRLTHPRFLRLYQQILAPGGRIHVKTDSPDLIRFTRKVIGMYGLPLIHYMEDIHQLDGITRELNIRTHYEGLDIARSRKVFYICFCLPAAPLADLDQALQSQLVADDQVIS